jgi:hypothetical protein
MNKQKQVEILTKAIKTVLPKVIREVNEVSIEKGFPLLYRKPFKEYMKGEKNKGAQASKMLSEIVGPVFIEFMEYECPDFIEYKERGSDFRFGDLLIEGKMSFGTCNSWLGNGFAKVPMHLLFKFHYDENGKITKAFVAFLDLDVSKSRWSKKSKTWNGSALKIHRADRKRIVIVVGELQVNRKWAYPIPVVV